jgi:hypothetical protein
MMLRCPAAVGTPNILGRHAQPTGWCQAKPWNSPLIWQWSNKLASMRTHPELPAPPAASIAARPVAGRGPHHTTCSAAPHTRHSQHRQDGSPLCRGLPAPHPASGHFHSNAADRCRRGQPLGCLWASIAGCGAADDICIPAGQVVMVPSHPMGPCASSPAPPPYLPPSPPD